MNCVNVNEAIGTICGNVMLFSPKDFISFDEARVNCVNVNGAIGTISGNVMLFSPKVFKLFWKINAETCSLRSFDHC